MSHVVVGTIPAKEAGAAPEVWEVSEGELDKFRKTCKARGLSQKDTQDGKWYGRWVNDYHGADAAYRHGIDPRTYGKGDLVFGMDTGGGYDLMLRKNDKGNYLLVFDNFDQRISQAIGKHGEKLYETFEAIGKIESQGLTVPMGADATSITSCLGMLDLMAEQGLTIAGDLTLLENGCLKLMAEPTETLMIQAGY